MKYSGAASRANLLQVGGELVEQVIDDVGGEDSHSQLVCQRGGVARHCRAQGGQGGTSCEVLCA